MLRSTMPPPGRYGATHARMVLEGRIGEPPVDGSPSVIAWEKPLYRPREARHRGMPSAALRRARSISVDMKGTGPGRRGATNRPDAVLPEQRARSSLAGRRREVVPNR